LVLDHAGVKVGKKAIKLGEVPREARLLATHRSETLSVLLRGVNKLSNNFMAEQILRSLAPGDHATAEAALAVVREYARGVGLPQDGLRIGNGSGLYDNNRISARALVQLLTHVHRDFRVRADFMASLPIMGRDGTLRRRLRETDGATWIRAKTGTLDGVSALSGYAGALGKNSPVVFAVLMNELGRWESGKAKATQDQIALALAHERAGIPMPILADEITGEIGDDE
jgi:D-alanyl-D-alanine carboxypeptidase/D-alanyl-D-alanine-endopeptidase (penicillin-binding protein 4)